MSAKSVTVHYRMPKALHDQLELMAETQFQSIPALLRQAAAEFVAKYRTAPSNASGLILTWPEDDPSLTMPDTLDTRQMSLPFNNLKD